MSINVEKFKKLFQDIVNNYPTQQPDVDLNTAVGDDADRFSAERDNLLQFKLHGRDAFYLKKVTEALQRIEDGEFGECQECGEMISEARLLARPVATRCLQCKEEQERGEGHLLYQKRSHTHGRSLINGVKKLPIKNEEIMKEGALKFNKSTNDMGASAIG